VTVQKPQPAFYLGHPWFETMMELRHGEFPSSAGLAFGLRSDAPVPPEVREFLAKWVAGEIKRPKGRPRRNWMDREFTGNWVRATYALMLEMATEARDAGEHLAGTPSEVALEMTRDHLASDGHHMSVEAIRDAVNRRHGW